MKIECKIVSRKYVERMVKCFCEYQENNISEKLEMKWSQFPCEQFMAWDEKSSVWLTVDNRGGDCYVEQFDDYRDAVKWIKNENEI